MQVVAGATDRAQRGIAGVTPDNATDFGLTQCPPLLDRSCLSPVG
jgi:hypothetical protein